MPMSCLLHPEMPVLNPDTILQVLLEDGNDCSSSSSDDSLERISLLVLGDDCIEGVWY
jgi:phosphopentomutase